MKEYFVWLAKLVTGIVLLLVFIPLMIAAMISAASTAKKQIPGQLGPKVAVVELHGIIESEEEVLRKLHEHIANSDIKGIVLDINSPGGAVGPSQAIFSAVQKLKEKKPIVAAMGTVAASGGLYAALGASQVYSQPGTITGSIGVILQIPNVSELADRVGFRMVTIKSGALKDAGNSFEPIQAEARAYLEQTARRAHEDFMLAVAEGRNIPLETVRQFADGRILLGSQALDLKLVDGFGDVYDAGRAVMELAGEPLPEGEYPQLIRPEKPFASLSQILGTLSKATHKVTGGLQLLYLME